MWWKSAMVIGRRGELVALTFKRPDQSHAPARSAFDLEPGRRAPERRHLFGSEHLDPRPATRAHVEVQEVALEVGLAVEKMPEGLRLGHGRPQRWKR